MNLPEVEGGVLELSQWLSYVLNWPCRGEEREREEDERRGERMEEEEEKEEEKKKSISCSLSFFNSPHIILLTLLFFSSPLFSLPLTLPDLIAITLEHEETSGFASGTLSFPYNRVCLRLNQFSSSFLLSSFLFLSSLLFFFFLRGILPVESVMVTLATVESSHW